MIHVHTILYTDIAREVINTIRLIRNFFTYVFRELTRYNTTLLMVTVRTGLQYTLSNNDGLLRKKDIYKI